MKSHLKLNGVIQLTNHIGDINAFESELLQNKYIKAGWRTRQQVLDLGLDPQMLEEKLVVDREASQCPAIVGGEPQDNIARFETEEEFQKFCSDFGFEYVKDEVDGSIEYAYNIPQKDHKEFFVPANYTIEVEDTSAQEAAEAQAKAEDAAELEQIKTMIENIDTTKPLDSQKIKRILKRIVKEMK